MSTLIPRPPPPPPPPPESLPQEHTIPTGNTQIVDKKRDKGRNEDLRPMTDEECLLANPVVKGFDLKARQWCK